jgi:site-specific recombinase XerC
MARHAEGWRLRLPPGRTIHVVRFTHNGRTVDRSTGHEDPREAARAAARIYADYVQREPGRRRVVRRGDSPPLEELIAEWLEQDSTLDPETVETWTVYGRHWMARWTSTSDLIETETERYRNDRLRVVLATTVRKELTALRRFIRWLVTHGYLGREVQVPGVPSKATGTRYARPSRQSAPELTPKQVRALIAALPEWSSSKKLQRQYPIRARFQVAYETGLRPSTLDALSVPEHWHPGSRRLLLTNEVDKNRWGRELPLSPAAAKALASVAPKEGLIFGSHDYRERLDEAARKALPAAVADRFSGAHLRSAFITHALEKTGNLAGVQYLAGHRQAKTTGSYARPSLRAAEAALDAFRGRSSNSGDARSRRRA